MGTQTGSAKDSMPNKPVHRQLSFIATIVHGSRPGRPSGKLSRHSDFNDEKLMGQEFRLAEGASLIALYPALTRLSELVKGRRVTLVGSAPVSPALSIATNDDEILVCVNASVLGLVPHTLPEITVINTAVAGSKRAGVQTRERLSEIRTRCLIIVESAIKLEDAVTIFEPILRETTEHILIDHRCNILEQILNKPLTGRTGGDHVPSTVFLLAFCYCCVDLHT